MNSKKKMKTVRQKRKPAHLTFCVEKHTKP